MMGGQSLKWVRKIVFGDQFFIIRVVAATGEISSWILSSLVHFPATDTANLHRNMRNAIISYHIIGGKQAVLCF
jgi:hypothetical protein